MPRPKDDDQQHTADKLFTQGRSVRFVARRLRVSVGWAHKLREHWRASMAPAPTVTSVQPPAGPSEGLPVGLADAKTARDIEALLRCTEKTALLEVTFEEIYRWTREVCPHSDRRNNLFAAWSATQVYPGSPDDPNAAKVKDVAVLDSSPTSAESEAPTEALKVASEEEIATAQRWAGDVLHRYEVFRLRSDHGNLIEISRNAEGLFTKAQVERAQIFIDNPLYGKRPGE